MAQIEFNTRSYEVILDALNAYRNFIYMKHHSKYIILDKKDVRLLPKGDQDAVDEIEKLMAKIASLTSY